MNFIYENKEVKAPTFGDVKENQFFVDNDGSLCQKTDYSNFTVVAAPDGTPYSAWMDETALDRKIQRIIPTVRKIEF